MSPQTIHQTETAAVLDHLESRMEGLRASEVLERLAKLGSNRIEPAGRVRWWRLLAAQFTNLFCLLLVVSGLLCFVADRLAPGGGMDLLGVALLGVSILNGLFAFAQLWRAEKAMEAIAKFLPPQVVVRREGREVQIRADGLVPGDLIRLQEGDLVAADARLIEADGLQVNNAPLTGESATHSLDPGPSKSRLVDSHNIVFAGCSVVRGSGVAAVFATGPRSEFGQVASMSEAIERPETPLERETGRMVRILTAIATLMGLTFFAFGVAAGRPILVNLVFMLGIIVANVPEGLVPTFTLALSMASLRMARKNVLVRRLQAVETLGAVHVICTDKTGTLTMNALSVKHLVDAKTGEEFGSDASRREFLERCIIASEVRYQQSVLKGDSLDVALAKELVGLRGDPPKVLATRVRHFSFDVAKRRQAGVRSDGSGVLFVVKGAWETLRALLERSSRPLDREQLARWDAVVAGWATTGLRVIAVAERPLPEVPGGGELQDSLETDLTLAGFVVLDDPPRPEVHGAVARCRRAGIAVVVISGDHPATAAAIARKCGILGEADTVERAVMTGGTLEALTEAELAASLQGGVVVFARTTPLQKMKIVTALKRTGKVIAMTGDGVNDAPALKAADVGIAMGLGGTDVAREIADIVLLDDNFASIVNGIEEGRSVHDNIRKFTTYVLASNVPEIVPYIIYILFPVPLALTVIQILSVDLGTDLLPAIGLGAELPETDTMERPPYLHDARLLDGKLLFESYLFLGAIQATWSMGLFFWVLLSGGWSYGDRLTNTDALYRSATAITLVSTILMQIANVIGRRSRTHSGLDRGLMKNRLILVGIATEILFVLAILYVPSVASFMGTGPVSPSALGLALLGIPIFMALDMVRKRWIGHGPETTTSRAGPAASSTTRNP